MLPRPPRFFLNLPLAAGCVALATLCSSTEAAVVYSNDFQTNTNGFSLSSTTVLPSNSSGSTTSTFLGRFGNQTAALTVGGLTPAVSHTLAFDLFIGATWDGNSGGGIGPDTWRLGVSGGNTMVLTTFSNFPPPQSNQTQAYSDTNFIAPGTNTPQTGADFAGTSNGSAFSIYKFGTGAGNPTLTFTPTGTTTTFNFAAEGLQSIEDEFWAIDNVVISNQVITPPPTGSVPEPVAGVVFVVLPALLLARRLWKTGRGPEAI